MWWYMPGNQSQQQVQHVFKTLDTQHNNHTKQKKKKEKKLTAYLYGHERRRDKNDIF